MRWTTVLAGSAMLLVALPVRAQSVPGISGDRIRADMQVLSSDSFAGRKPGTPSERTTTDFLIKRFEEVGLTRAPGNSWLQPVKLITRRMESVSLVLRGASGETTDLSDSAVLVGDSASMKLDDVPVVWGGYLKAGKVGRTGMAGALVLYRDSDPPGTPQPQPTDGVTRLGILASAGARGVLAVVADNAFQQRKAAFESGVTMLASDPTVAVRGVISESGVVSLLNAAGMNLSQLEAVAATPSSQAIAIPLRADVNASTSVVRFTSHNVAGVLRGASQPDEYVMYTAHWDSFGRCRPGAADEICNGAIDNASGTAGMIELARAIASGPRPDRSVLFLATTAEEMGLAGSRQYGRTPLVPLARTVAEFNLDVIVLYDRGNSAGFVGAGLTDADSVLGALVAAQGRTVETGGLAKMVLRSSDAWSLLMAGVPSFILSGAIGSGQEGSKAFHEYLATRYHGPGDEFLADMPMGGAVEEVELLYTAGSYYGRAGTRVKFKEGVGFQRRH